MTARLRIAVVVGGAVGTMLRWALAHLPAANGLPTGTLVANVLGSLALGLVLGWLGDRGADPSWTPLTAGLIGASTTFAAFIVEVVDLWPQQPTVALAYVALSLVFGLAAVALGRFLSAGAHT